MLDFIKNLFSSTQQLTRIVILTGVAVILAAISFGWYYYADRYVAPIEDVSPIEQSLFELEEAVRNDPQNSDLRLALAENYLVNRQYDQALEQAQNVYQAFPEKDRALLIMGISYVLTERPQEAIEPLKNFVSVHEKSEMAFMDTALASALYYLGESYLQLEQPVDAIDAFTRSLEINRTDADAMYKLGQAYAQAGQHEDAIKTYERAIQFVPNFSEVYQGMVESYLALNQPNHAAYARGMLAYSIKDYEGARVELEQVVVAEPDFVPAYFGLGLVYEQLGDLDTALSYVNLALDLDPEDIAALQLKGRLEAATP